MRRNRAFLCRLAALTLLSVALSACSLFNPAPPVPQDNSAPVASETEVADELPPVKRTVKWQDCGKRFDCATVRVPVDHDQPKGEKIALALIRLPAPPAADRIGSLIVNPGGPGGSGVDFVRYGAVETVPAEVRARFDIVGFDPRGVGKSAGIECGTAPQEFLSQDFMPEGSSDVATILDAARTVAQDCAAANADLLPHMSTADVAADLDRIRRAVGDRQLTYLGFSYGSTIGLTYAEQFPAKVRALVLDGPVDPAIDGLQRAHDQAGVLEKTLRDFFKVCPRERECRTSARGRKLSLAGYDDLLQRLEADPLPAYGGTRSLHPAEALSASAALLKDRSTGWPYLAAGLGMADAGDGSLLLAVAESAMSDRTPERQWLAPLLAVNCLDIPAPDPPDYGEAVDDLTAKSRHFGALMLLLSSPCSFWEEPPQREPAPVTAPTAAPAIVIGTTGDPTTPYSWAKAVAKNLRGARLITRESETHTAFGQRNVCTDRTVSTYVVDLVLPAPGLSCG